MERVVINDGAKGGQEVFHLHVHLIGKLLQYAYFRPLLLVAWSAGYGNADAIILLYCTW